MLKLLGLFIKLALFAVFVLVLGNWLQWRGKSISDQVKLGMSHAEHTQTFSQIKKWATTVSHEAQLGFQKRESETSSKEDIPDSERQKLRSLIRELNRSHGRGENSGI